MGPGEGWPESWCSALSCSAVSTSRRVDCMQLKTLPVILFTRALSTQPARCWMMMCVEGEKKKMFFPLVPFVSVSKSLYV